MQEAETTDKVATSSDDLLVYLKSIYLTTGILLYLVTLTSQILIGIILLAPLHFQMIFVTSFLIIII